MAKEETTESKSIIPEKYRGVQRDPDWLANFIDTQVKTPVMKTVKDDDGNESEVPSAKTVIDLDKLFSLCDQNGIDTTKMEEQRDRPNAPGRIRMTLGNSLRAAAKRRHGLNDLNGEWHDAPAEFLGDAEKKENPDGSKIAAAKPETEEA